MFTKHNLGDGLLFLVGLLPRELDWDNAMFEAVWTLHPPDMHWIMIHGKLVQTPRYQQAFGADYHYTGRVNKALPVPDVLVPLHTWVQTIVDDRLNGILLNWYEGPGHYIGPHHDSVKDMIRGAPIITVSFGETRTFRLSRGKGDDAEAKDFPASPGTVFVMPFDTNLTWKHGVPKSTRYTGRRISVTFRAFSGD